MVIWNDLLSIFWLRLGRKIGFGTFEKGKSIQPEDAGYVKEALSRRFEIGGFMCS
jgi:hypothetical protein